MAKNVYEIVTEQLIKTMEETETLIWEQGWKLSGLPANFDRKTRPYSGFNSLVCMFQTMKNGWRVPYFLTFNQAKKHGGTVKRGEKGTILIYWKLLEKDDETRPGKKKQIPFLRYYRVWNIDQTTIEYEVPDTPEQIKIPPAEEFISNLPEEPRIGYGAPSYAPHSDTISIPKVSDMVSPERYYKSLFHELVHWTGSSSRLSREGITQAVSFGSDIYAYEELIAECGAAFCCALTGTQTEETHKTEAAYLKNWVSVLKQNPRWIIKAASEAQKAVNWMQGADQAPIPV